MLRQTELRTPSHSHRPPFQQTGVAWVPIQLADRMLVEFDEITYRFEETRPAAKITHCTPSTTGIFGLGVVASGTITCAAIGERDVYSALTIDM